MRGLTVTLTLPTPGFLSSPPGLRFHPFAHIGRESARRRWRADPTAGLGRSLPAAAARYRFRWPRRCAPRIWWSPPSPPAAASAPGRVRTGPAGLPEHACDALRERKLGVLDVQLDIHRKLTDVTLGAHIVGTREVHPTEDRQNGFAADFLVLGVMATGARQLTLLGRRSFELQQFA